MEIAAFTVNGEIFPSRFRSILLPVSGAYPDYGEIYPGTNSHFRHPLHKRKIPISWDFR